MPECVAMMISTDGRFAAGERAFHVALEQRGKRLLRFPLGMLRREHLHALERKDELEIHRLLGPERAVVVEGGDALGGGTKSDEPSFVTFSTKATMAFFDAVSFQDGSGSCAWVVVRPASAITSQRMCSEWISWFRICLTDGVSVLFGKGSDRTLVDAARVFHDPIAYAPT